MPVLPHLDVFGIGSIGMFIMSGGNVQCIDVDDGAIINQCMYAVSRWLVCRLAGAIGVLTVHGWHI